MAHAHILLQQRRVPLVSTGTVLHVSRPLRPTRQAPSRDALMQEAHGTARRTIAECQPPSRLQPPRHRNIRLQQSHHHLTRRLPPRLHLTRRLPPKATLRLQPPRLHHTRLRLPPKATLRLQSQLQRQPHISSVRTVTTGTEPTVRLPRALPLNGTQRAHGSHCVLSSAFNLAET